METTRNVYEEFMNAKSIHSDFFEYSYLDKVYALQTAKEVSSYFSYSSITAGRTIDIDERAHHMNVISSYVEYMNNFDNFEKMLENLSDEEVEEFINIINDKIALILGTRDFKKSQKIPYLQKRYGISKISKDNIVDFGNIAIYSYYPEIISMLTEYANSHKTIYYSKDEIRENIDSIGSYKTPDGKRVLFHCPDFENMYWETRIKQVNDFEEKFYFQFFEEKKYSIDPALKDFPFMLDEYKKLIVALLDEESLQEFSKLSTEIQNQLVISLPYLTKESIDYSIKYRNDNHFEERELNQDIRERRSYNREMNKRHYTKRRYPKIRQRGKQRSFAR